MMDFVFKMMNPALKLMNFPRARGPEGIQKCRREHTSSNVINRQEHTTLYTSSTGKVCIRGIYQSLACIYAAEIYQSLACIYAAEIYQSLACIYAAEIYQSLPCIYVW